MNLPRHALTAAPLVVVAWLIDVSTSYACAGYQCANDQFLPRGGTVPANIEAIAWAPGYDVRAGASAVVVLPRFQCVAADGSTREVIYDALPADKPDHLQLREALVAGEHCTLTGGIAGCTTDDPELSASYLAAQAEFDVADASPAPESLGLIAVTPANLGDVDVAADASCSENLEVCMVSSALDFSSAALPWKDALLFETFVDGQRFSTGRNLAVPGELGGLYFGRDADIVFVPMGPVPENVSLGQQLDPGEHTLQIKAHLPGSAQTLTTPPVTIVLSCGGPQPQLAESNIGGGSDGCAVMAGAGSARQPLTAALWTVLGVLLTAARRRRR